MIIDGQNHWDNLLEPDDSDTKTNLEGDTNPDNQNDPTPEPIPNDTNSDPEPKDKDLDVFSEFLKGRGLRDGKTLIYQIDSYKQGNQNWGIGYITNIFEKYPNWSDFSEKI